MNDIEVGNGGRTFETDLRTGDHNFKVKTASMGTNKTFQFNHVRLDRHYGFLLCLGICPHEIVFNMWRKGDVSEVRAGKLVRMAEGQSVTYKITNKRVDMMPIVELPGTLHTTGVIPE